MSCPHQNRQADCCQLTSPSWQKEECPKSHALSAQIQQVLSTNLRERKWFIVCKTGHSVSQHSQVGASAQPPGMHSKRNKQWTTSLSSLQPKAGLVSIHAAANKAVVWLRDLTFTVSWNKDTGSQGRKSEESPQGRETEYQPRLLMCKHGFLKHLTVFFFAL